MDRYSENNTPIIDTSLEFSPISSGREETAVQKPEELETKEANVKGWASLPTDLVNIFEKKFPTATFTLIIVGYILIATFGNNLVNLWQYFLVIFVSYLVYQALKNPTIVAKIFAYSRKLGCKIAIFIKSYLFWLFVSAVVVVFAGIYLFYGKPKLYFEKTLQNKDCSTNNHLYIEALK